MKLSIVTTLYQSASSLVEFHRRVSIVAEQLAEDDYEIVLVNDGSPDDGLEIAVGFTETDPHVVVVDLSRNFGHHKAMMSGLEHSIGDQVFLLDSDLEEDPEWLIEFSQYLIRGDSDVVYGVQKSRKGGCFERWSGEIFYTFFNWLSDLDHPRNIVTARLMSRRYVNALLKHQEREIVISCLWLITGFKQTEVVIEKHRLSRSSYSMGKKVSLAINGITSFCEKPLIIIFYIGFWIFLLSLVYTGFLVINKLIFSQAVDGWTSVMASIWLLGGMVISFIGVIGIYLSKIFLEIKQRPLVIVRKIYSGREL